MVCLFGGKGRGKREKKRGRKKKGIRKRREKEGKGAKGVCLSEGGEEGKGL